jgi:hypothetical protein
VGPGHFVACSRLGDATLGAIASGPIA